MDIIFGNGMGRNFFFQNFKKQTNYSAKKKIKKNINLTEQVPLQTRKVTKSIWKQQKINLYMNLIFLYRTLLLHKLFIKQVVPLLSTRAHEAPLHSTSRAHILTSALHGAIAVWACCPLPPPSDIFPCRFACILRMFLYLCQRVNAVFRLQPTITIAWLWALRGQGAAPP